VSETPTTAAPATAAAPTTEDVYRACNFKIVKGGETIAHFVECGGISADVNIAEYREGGQAQVVHKIPTYTSYNDVVLRYGVTSSRVMWDWFVAVTRGQVDRANVSVILLGADGTTPVIQWDLIAAFPRRWTSSDLRASAREVAIEEIVLAYESLGREV
jgi:phage tail-like protein